MVWYVTASEPEPLHVYQLKRDFIQYTLQFITKKRQLHMSGVGRIHTLWLEDGSVQLGTNHITNMFFL